MIFFILLLVAAAVVLLAPKKAKTPASSSSRSVILSNPEPPRAPTEQEAVQAMYLIDRYLESSGKSETDRSCLRHEILLLLHGEEA